MYPVPLSTLAVGYFNFFFHFKLIKNFIGVLFMVVVGIVGSRDFTDYGLLCDIILPLCPSSIVSGGAKGADSLAVSFAKDSSLPFIVFEADWDRFGRTAGPIRNREIVGNSDILVAFWNGESRGTLSSLKWAFEMDVPTIIVNYRSGTVKRLRF